MKPQQLLNADMATLARAMRAGFDWWCQEMVALLPGRGWRPGARRVGNHVLVTADDIALVDEQGRRISHDFRGEGADQPVLVPDHMCLVRRITLPALNRADLGSMLQLDGDRYFPMPAGSALFAAGPRQDIDGGMMAVDVAAMPLGRAQSLAARMAEHGIRPSSVRSVGEGGHDVDPRFDFLPSLRSAGLVARTHERAAYWWAIVGFLFVLNIFMIVWRDSAGVEALQRMVDDQRPAVMVAHRDVGQTRNVQIIAERAARKRQRNDALKMLAQVSEAVPDGAWVQRYAFEGNALRLTGYRQPDADVAGALRKLSLFVSVKSAQSDEAAAISTGQPFDLVAQLREN